MRRNRYSYSRSSRHRFHSVTIFVIAAFMVLMSFILLGLSILSH